MGGSNSKGGGAGNGMGGIPVAGRHPCLGDNGMGATLVLEGQACPGVGSGMGASQYWKDIPILGVMIWGG